MLQTASANTKKASARGNSRLHSMAAMPGALNAPLLAALGNQASLRLMQKCDCGSAPDCGCDMGNDKTKKEEASPRTGLHRKASGSGALPGKDLLDAETQSFFEARLQRKEQRSAPPRSSGPSIAIGAVDDPLEHEADQIADRVMRMPNTLLPASIRQPTLHRKCANCEEENKRLQKKNDGRGDAESEAPPIVHQALNSPGRPLDTGTRVFFETHFDRDLSRVRVHTGAIAGASARAVNALAYTVGPDVVFAEGRYTSRTTEGRRLLAHELTHTLQQSGAATRPVRGDLRGNGAADRAMSPSTAPILQRQGPPAAAPPVSTAPSAPAASGPACPAVPAATPGSCGARHTAYCAAKPCFSANQWLGCVCRFSQGVCDAVDAFHLDPTTLHGAGLLACLATTPINPFYIPTIMAKGDWFLNTNQCIWGHWRAAMDALNDPSRPVPTGLTPQWAAAVTTCRASGLGSPACCNAHVVAEQTAIDLCSPYDSARFGPSPTDVPGAPVCSIAANVIAPGKPFKGDFGVLADRIAYGNSVCCP